MLTENDIIAAVSDYLRSRKYRILQALHTSEKGIDIIAEHEAHTLYIEAKGETSSKEASNRFGSSFDKNQVKSHISKAILASMILLNSRPSGPKTKVGIALPDSTGHRDLISRIPKPLKTLGIKVFWVSKDKVVEEQS